MALIRKTVVDQIEITRMGGVQVRFALLIEDDGEEVSCKYHRTMFTSPEQVAPTMAAVNEQLARMKVPPVPQGAVTRIEQIVTAVHPYLAPVGSPQ